MLQGKGGVGKSFVSAILAQYFRTKSAPVHCLDTDPVNATFAQYRLLEAEHLKVLKRGTINEKQFDVFVEKVCHGDGVSAMPGYRSGQCDVRAIPGSGSRASESPPAGTVNEKQFDVLVEKVCHGDGVFIVDTGATTFVPLWNYILENEILDFFRAHGRSVFVHSVVTGGQAMSDTLNGLERLAQTTSRRTSSSGSMNISARSPKMERPSRSSRLPRSMRPSSSAPW